MYRGLKGWYANLHMSGHHKVERDATRQDILIMIVTFVVALFAGFYLYVTAFAPQFEELSGQTEEVYEDFVLEGTQYGGDRMGGTAPSFQVLGNGTYRYLPYTPEGAVGKASEGTVPRLLLNEVKNGLTEEALATAATIVTRGDCMSYVDGLDYNYAVTLNGENYTLDTCTTNLKAEGALSITLDKLWNYFATGE